MNVLGIPQAREIAGTLAGKILNVLVMCWVGTCMVLCPFPCNVLVMYWPGKLVLAPSVSPFQEAMLESGLREFHESQDQMPGCADVPIGFASVIAGEYFEAIGELTDEMIHNDLLVRRLSV